MRVALIAPPFFPVPPHRYGGIERIVGLLDKGLSNLGIDVVVFGHPDSNTCGKLVSHFAYDFLEYGFDWRLSGLHASLSVQVCEEENIDLIHCHDCLQGPAVLAASKIPSLITLHNPVQDIVGTVVKVFSDSNFCAISESQKAMSDLLKDAPVVYNAIDFSSIPLKLVKEDYLAFVGSFLPTKGLHIAIQAAIKSGRKLRVAAKPLVEGHAPEVYFFFETFVKPWLDNHPLIEYFGEVDENERNALMGNAQALLCPTQWDEPFGLVAIEAMACGTPVIAFERGAFKETIKPGVTGFLVNGFRDLLLAIEKVTTLDPRDCRQHVEVNFSSDRMVNDYLKQYKRILGV